MVCNELVLVYVVLIIPFVFFFFGQAHDLSYVNSMGFGHPDRYE